MPMIIVPCPAELLQNPQARGRHRSVEHLTTAQSFSGLLMAARITSWPEDSQYPIGQVWKNIGPIGDIAAETQAILCGNNVDDTEFPPEACRHACMPFLANRVCNFRRWRAFRPARRSSRGALARMRFARCRADMAAEPGRSPGAVTAAIGSFAPSTRRLPGEMAALIAASTPLCSDLDDALSCSQLPNGNFEVGVHIADVSFGTPCI